MPDQAPNIDVKPGQGGKLVYDKTRRTIVAEPEKARPLSEWHEDMGPVLWWEFPINEPPYCGTPHDLGQTVEMTARAYGIDKLMRFTVGGWPDNKTHWTPLPPKPVAP